MQNPHAWYSGEAASVVYAEILCFQGYYRLSKVQQKLGSTGDAFHNLMVGLQQTMLPEEQVEFLKEAVPMALRVGGNSVINGYFL